MSLIIRSLKEVWIVPWSVIISIWFWCFPKWWKRGGSKWPTRKVAKQLLHLYSLRFQIFIQELLIFYTQLKTCFYLGQLNFQVRIAIFIHNFRVWYFLNLL